MVIRSPLPGHHAHPVRVSLRLSTVVEAGLAAVLRPHVLRVVLVAATDRGPTHVEIFDPGDDRPRPRSGAPRVALSWDVGAAATARARELGAVRVLPISVGVPDLLHTLEQVHREWPVTGPHDPDLRLDVGSVLSRREAEVIAGIGRGLSNGEIAEELVLSVNSVKTYVRTAYRKMGVTSRSQAVLWWIEGRP